MSLLSNVQNAAASVNTTIPTSIVGNSNADARQWLALANMTVREIGRRHEWADLVVSHTWTSTATEAQTAAIVADDFDRLVSDVQIWNQSTNELLIGPTPSNDWIGLHSSAVTGGPGYWRYFAAAIHIYPAPTAGDTYALEYVSQRVCADFSSKTWTADTDSLSFSWGSVENVFELGLVWRWLRAHGMDYAEELASFERELEKAAARERGLGVMVVDRRRGPSSWPGTIIP